MRCDMPDGEFLECVDLAHPTMRRAAELAGKGRTKRAAREAARAMFARPFRHRIDEAEIPALAKIINRRWPEQVAWLKRLADHYLLRESASRGLVCGGDPEEEHALYSVCARNWPHRGENVHALARLYRLTGERKYRDGAVEAFRRIVTTYLPPLPDGEHVGAFAWHPFSAAHSHEPGHIAEKVCHALPYLRADLSADEALMFAKGLLAMADFAFRTCRRDVTHNITLHMLTGALLVGLCLPALRDARQWVSWVRRRLETDFAGRPFVTPDGYFGEGFGYQAVNHNLMFLCLRYLLAAGRTVSPKLRRIVEQSFEFAAAITRTDGKCAEFGDCHAHMPHEHYIFHHEMLHAAAACFRRADFKAAAGSPYREDPLEYNAWLMGLEGLAWWDSVQVPARAARVLVPYDLRRSGFQIFGAGAGANAHAGLFACAATHNHAHCDFGSIDIYGLGRPLLTDPGVTGYGEDSYRDERAHNAVVPIRRKPLGPRIDRPDHVTTHFVIHRPDIQAACMEHDLYESHRIRRTVCLVTPDRDLPAFWLVIDHVERAWPYPTQPEPYDFLETYFHFNAPQSRLRRDPRTLTCWSRHDPAGLELLRYPPTDVHFEQRPRRVPLADFLAAYEYVDSDANLQVTAVLPHRPHFIMDMRLVQGFTGQYLGRVKRPSMAYRWQGCLPFDAAYVLVPFRGVRSQPYAAVTGRWSRSGDLTVSVALPAGRVNVRAVGLTARKPEPTFRVWRPHG